MEVKLKRADFLYTHRKPTPAPVPMIPEPRTMSPPLSSTSSPVVTKTEMIEEEVPSFDDKPIDKEDLIDSKDEAKNAFFINEIEYAVLKQFLVLRKESWIKYKII